MLPNFIIPGAPKCGTTAVYQYLKEHPDVFLPEKKEPNHFAADIWGNAATWREYVKLYDTGEREYTRSGDCSTGYLMSTVAIPAIEDKIPGCLYIVCLRDPVEIAASYHSELLYQGIEDIADFREAWYIQEARRTGNAAIPELCPSYRLLMYSDVASIGTQLERLYRYVDRERVLTVFSEDFMNDPLSQYSRILDFLELPADSRGEFPIVNQRTVRRSQWLHRFVRRLVLAKDRMGLGYMGDRVNRIYDWINGKSSPGRLVSPDLENELAEWFEDEIILLERLTGRNLDSLFVRTK
jgi:hypothetical protein